MKKFISGILSLILMISSLSFVSFAETEKVAGLHEKMDALRMVNNFTQEQLDDMRQQAKDSFDAGWESWLATTKMLGKTEGKTDVELYEEQWKFFEPDINAGFLVTCLNSNKYLYQFAEAGEFEYIVSDLNYWAVATTKRLGTLCFSVDGAYFKDSETIFDIPAPSVRLTDNVINSLNNVDIIEELLLTQGETEVEDIKLLAITELLPMLYVKCLENEYIIKVSDITKEVLIPEIEPLKLYSVLDVIMAMASKDTTTVAQNITTQKPIYTTEAEALQAGGLLNGNEKGLDLMKPLTRIEAITLLIRALGMENEQTETQSKFSDIPNDNWGVKYANIARDKGITNGVGDNMFAPDKKIDANQFATMVLRNSENGEFDWQKAIDLMVEKGIITQENAKTMDFFTRGDMAKIVYEARQKGLL